MAELICGIHLGQETLQAVALRVGKHGLTFEGGTLVPARAAAPPTEETAPAAKPAAAEGEEAEEEALDRGEDLIAPVKEVMRALKLGREAGAMISLPKQQGILRNVTLPSNDPEELAQMARFEIERHIPFHQERHASGYHVMRNLGVEGSEALLGALDGPIVERAVGGVEGAGMTPRGLTLSSVALVNALLFERQAGLEEKTVAALNIGLDTLDLVLLTGNRMQFARSANLDLRGVLRAWIGAPEGPDAPRPAPEKLALATRSIDCMDLEAHYSPGESGAAASEDGPARVRAWIAKMIQEVRRTCDFARREMKCPPIETLHITGEGARLRNLPQYLKANLGVEAEPFNPVGKLAGGGAAKPVFDGYEFSLPFGAALMAAQDDLYALDLIPEEHYQLTARRQIMKRLAVTGGLLILTLALAGGAWSQRQSINGRILSDYSNANRNMRERVAELSEMKAKTRIIQEFQRDPNAAMPVLASIANSNTIARRVTLTSVEYKKGETIDIQGDALTLPDIYAFMDDLRSSGHFADSMDMTSDPGQQYDQPLYHFKINAQFSQKNGAGSKSVKGSKS